MKALHAMERRLQDLQRKFENKERLGKIVDVKFENQRWMVKMNDGEDQSASGGSGGGGGGEGRTFKSDWQPWKSFSHGTIKMSVPPKKGQQVLMRSVGGQPELSTVEPHHYGPDNPSPHGKQDEMVKLIEDEEKEGGQEGGGEGGGSGSGGGEEGGAEGGEDKWNAWTRETKDTHDLIIRKKEEQSGGGGAEGADSGGESGGGGGGMDAMNSKGGQKKQKERKIPEVEEEGDDKTTRVQSTKDHILKTVGKKKSFYKQTKDDVHIRFGEQDEKADILMNEDSMTAQFKDKKAKVTWTEKDLTTQFGEDSNSKMVMTEDDVTITQGGDGATKITMNKDSTTISQGGSSWKLSGGKLEISVGGTTWTLDGSGWSQQGGQVAHDGKLIDSKHKHDGVMPGGGMTGLPILPSEGGGGGDDGGPPGTGGGGGDPGDGGGTGVPDV